MTAAEKMRRYRARKAQEHNSGCNYDPHKDTGEPAVVQRRRAMFFQINDALESARSRTFQQAENSEIDTEIVDAAQETADAWQQLAGQLSARKLGNGAAVTKSPAAEPDGDFALFARASRTLLWAVWDALQKPGRKQAVISEILWPIELLGRFVMDWPSLPPASRQYLANARNVAQMGGVYGRGGCPDTAALNAEIIAREVAANPDWPDPPPREDRGASDKAPGDCARRGDDEGAS
jgi:hypothetical protein